MKRIVLIVVIMLTAYFSAVVGGQIMLGYYQRKATIAFALSGDYEKAIEYYSKLIYWRPDNSIYYHRRGDAYYEAGQYEEALHDYNKVAEFDGENDLQLILSIALTLKQQGNLRTEENYLRKLLKMSKRDKDAEVELWAANYHLGQLAFKNKHYREAINFYNAAQALKATSRGIYHRANAYFALGKVDSARQDLKYSLSSVKAGFVRENPNSILAKCDTCAFPFGSKAFELLTESKRSTVIEALDMFPENKEVRELNAELKRVEENNK